jgi:ketosteroid isomerase-like protein
MSDDGSKTPFELLQQYIAKRREGDAAGAMAMVDENVELNLPESLPWGGLRRGRDGLTAIRTEAAQHLKVDPSGDLKLLDAGDIAIINFNGTATGVRTGKPCVYRTLEVYRYEDGKAARIDMFYFDTAGMLDAMGPLEE